MTEPTDPLYDDAYLRGVALGFPQGDTRRWTLCRIADRIEAARLPAPELTAERVSNIGFAVLRAHNDDRLWRALTYDGGPYDLTTPNLALCDLGRAFYAAGLAASNPKP